MFSILQNLNPENPVKYAKALRMFEVAVEFCEFQASLGGRFILEHPLTSRAWRLPCAMRLISRADVMMQDFHMCAHGGVSRDEQGEAPILKPTRVLTNSAPATELLGRRCGGGHRHVQLMSGRAKAAAGYPRPMCDKIIQAALIHERAREEMDMRSQGPFGLDVRQSRVETDSSKSEVNMNLCEMCDPGDMVTYRLDYVESMGNKWICPRLVHAARMQELETFRKMSVYRYASMKEFQANPQAKLIGVTWVDASTGSEDALDIRSWLCGQGCAAPPNFWRRLECRTCSSRAWRNCARHLAPNPPEEW